MEVITPVRKPSQVIAWLGFGLSLTVLVLIWVVNVLVFTHIGERDFPAAALYMLVILIGGFLGLMGLIFSIIGLVSANKYFDKKWPSVSGIIFCCLSLLSLFAPIIIASTIKSSPTEVMQLEQNENPSSNSGIILYITNKNRLKCFDNRNGIDNKPAVISMFSADKKHELQTWMQMSNIDKDANFTIKTDTDVEYSDVVDIIDILKELGVTKFQLSSATSVQ